MTEDYDIDFDPLVGGDSNGEYSRAMPKVLDPVMTVQVVQKFMEVERRRNRRALLWLSSIFLFVIMLILSLFAGIGMHVLRESKSASTVARMMQAETSVYASEVLGISKKLEKLSEGTGEIEGIVRMSEDARLKEGRVLRTDLERFGRWVESRTSSEKQTIDKLMARLDELEERLANAPAPPPAAARAEHVVVTPEDDMAEPVAPAAPEISVDQVTAPEVVANRIDGDFDIALAEPVRVAVPVPPLDKGDVSVVTFPNGDSYKGAFKAGLFHGWGEYSYKTGDHYEGSFDNDLKSGKGTYVYANGDKYVGDFKNDMREGIGSMMFGSGDKYVGQFRNDAITGKGARFYKSGNKYSGDFKDGVKQGNGVLSYFNGDSYKGEFKDDLRDGRGIYIFSDGSKYIGDFKEDKRQGSGRFIFADGGEYVGAFRDGMKHGEGLCIYPDGRRLKGLWKDDRFVKVLE